MCRRYPLIVGPHELRQARRKGKITYFAGKKGAVHYHPDAVAEYLETKIVRPTPPLRPLHNSALKRDRPLTEKQLRDQAEGEAIFQKMLEDRILNRVKSKKPPKRKP